MLYDIFEKIYKLEKEGKKIVKLSVGEPDWHAPKGVLTATYQAMKHGKDKYSSSAGEIELREKIAKLHSCDVKNIVVTPGSKIGIYAILKFYLKIGDNAIIFSPHWTAYELMCKSLGASAKILKLKQENEWKVDFDALDEIVDEKTKIIILNSPSNPTSHAWKENEEWEIIEFAKRKGLLVLADDAYRDLCFDERKERKFENNLVVANTFSKTFGMTGWRIGYMVAPEAIVKELIAFNQIAITNVPQFLQIGALKALENKDKVAKDARRLCMKRLELATSILKGHVEFSKPNAGFYIFPRLPNKIDTLQFVNEILDDGVAVIPGAAFGDYPQHIRISLCREETVLKSALGKIVELIR
ncbi:MAG: pyridoxal phosphate-dependent aminotransferase [Candidatus Micrarchaeota archaeon]|nr:pyridoxal phosphate-dependent aminotransferase [Candidatus Micrarchaeota archaeon]